MYFGIPMHVNILRIRILNMLYSVVVLNCLFARFIITCSHLVRDPFFGAHTKMGAVIFFCLYFFVAAVQLVFTSSRHAGNSLSNSSCPFYFSLVSKGGPYPFPVVPHPCRRFGSSVFKHFNYRSYSLVTGWHTTSALAWLTKDSPSTFSYHYSPHLSLFFPRN